MRRVTCTACGVKNEKLGFLSDNTKYTLRFAMQIGGLCRAMTITDVARRMHLDWHTVKELDKIYRREQLARSGHRAPNVIGVDEVSIKKRHVYRIVVSDLERKRAIWFGGKGRGEQDMDMFYAFLGRVRRFISRKTPSRCIFFLRILSAWSTLLSRTNTCKCFPIVRCRHERVSRMRWDVAHRPERRQDS
jgi:hypothetical protein